MAIMEETVDFALALPFHGDNELRPGVPSEMIDFLLFCFCVSEWAVVQKIKLQQ
ncbi:hypothetical protein H6P81_004384 [Aristolochia fimbriata]|uniref:Uncharacterized protein n=1 Tax=Aristolochia fimbriata TaxID=158543 RepID=A0AAV7FGA9_ARIFI|nr:hypothetical protein H6P81_004384 [Aristolochia fimbriata]